MFAQFSLEVAGMLSRSTSLSTIVQYAGRMLGNPLMVTDETFCVLAYTQSQPVPDPVWQEIISNRASSPRLVDQTNVNGFWKRLENSPAPLFVDEEAFKGCAKRAVAKIKVGSRTKGYIALLEYDRPIDEEDMQALQMLAEMLGIKFHEESSVSEAVGQMRDRFAKEILTGAVDSEKTIRRMAETMKLKFSAWHMVVSVRPVSAEEYIGRHLDVLSDLFKRAAGLCIYTFDGISAYYILSFPKKPDEKNMIRRTVQEYIVQNRFLCFVSRAAGRLTDLENCCREVREMAETFRGSAGGKTIFFYKYFAPCAMIQKAFEGNGGEIYRCEALERLVRYDQEYGTHCVETLRSFFRNNQNVSDTAKELFLHRNTVNYRIAKIREILGEDFDDHRIRLHLQMTVMYMDIVQMNK